MIKLFMFLFCIGLIISGTNWTVNRYRKYDSFKNNWLLYIPIVNIGILIYRIYIIMKNKYFVT